MKESIEKPCTSLQLNGVTLNFAHKKALDNVSVSFVPGKIHALLGENGAGKSCLADILCGFRRPSSGTVVLDGKPVFFTSPAAALKSGVAVVRQHPVLLEKGRVWENVFLGYSEKRKRFFAFKQTVKAKLDSLCREWNVSLDPDLAIEDTTDAERFYIALFTALLHNPVFLLLDEPSALLNEEERCNFLVCLKRKVAEGLGIVYITHNVKEAAEFCNSVYVLRKGQLAAVLENSDFQLDEKVILEKMFDKPVRETDPSLESYSGTEQTAFEVSNLYTFSKKAKNLENFSFSACYGRITLVKINSRYALEDILTGMYNGKVKGSFYINGNEVFPYNTKNLRNLGVGIVSSKKYIRSSSPALTVKELMIPYFVKKYDTKFREADAFAQNLVDSEDIDISIEEPVSDLSGGMLQRLIFGREFSCRPKILILCEPLYGFDKNVCAIVEYNLRLLADSGVAVIILSTDSESCPETYDKVYDFLTLDGKK